MDETYAIMAVAAFCRAAGLNASDADRVWQSLRVSSSPPATPGEFYREMEKRINLVKGGEPLPNRRV